MLGEPAPPGPYRVGEQPSSAAICLLPALSAAASTIRATAQGLLAGRRVRVPENFKRPRSNGCGSWLRVGDSLLVAVLSRGQDSLAAQHLDGAPERQKGGSGGGRLDLSREDDELVDAAPSQMDDVRSRQAGTSIRRGEDPLVPGPFVRHVHR